MSLERTSSPPIDRAEVVKAAAAMGILGAGAQSGPRIMAMLCNAQVTARDVTALIGTEPAIYARVLRVANSPIYGQRRSVTSIERALVLLGLDAVRGIAAAVCLDRTMACGGDANTVDTPALLAHSLATAAAAEWLTGHVRRIPAPEAFIAGLLHNLGVVVQLTVDPPRVQNMIAARRGDPERGIRALELECSAVSHEECAAIVFDAWQLPDSLVAATRHHHDPMAAAEAHRELAALVHVGAHLALVCGNTFDLEPAAADLDVRATAHLGLTAADLGRAAVELPQRITELRRAVLGG